MKLSVVVSFLFSLVLATSSMAQGSNFFCPSKTRIPPDISRCFFGREWTDVFTGYDFKTGKADSVYAMAKGTVAFIIDSSKYSHDGANVFIIHELADSNKMMAVYRLIDHIAVKDSQKVVAGQFIGVSNSEAFYVAGFIGNEYPITENGDTSFLTPTYGFVDPSTWANTSQAHLCYHLFDFEGMNYAKEGFSKIDTSCFKLRSPDFDSLRLDSSFLVFSMKVLPGNNSGEPTGMFVNGNYIRDGRVELGYRNGMVGNSLPIELVNSEYSYNSGIFNPKAYNVFRVDISNSDVKNFSLIFDQNGYIYDIDWIKVLKKKELRKPVYKEKSFPCQNLNSSEDFHDSLSIRKCVALQSTIKRDTSNGGCILVNSGKEMGVGFVGDIAGQLGCDSLLGFSIDVKPDSNASAIVVRVKSSVSKGWSKTFNVGSLIPGKWSTLFVPLSSRWSDDQAKKIGWGQEAPYSIVDFKETVKNAECLEVYAASMAAPYPKGSELRVDNLEFCYDSSCFYSAFEKVYPTQFSVVSMDNQQMVLSWQSVMGAEGYKIYRYTAGGDSVFLGFAEDTFYVCTNPLPGATYKVSAVTQNGAVESALSVEFKFEYEDESQKWIPYTTSLGTVRRGYGTDTSFGFSDYLHVLEGDMNKGFQLTVNGKYTLNDTNLTVDYVSRSTSNYRIYYYVNTNRGKVNLIIGTEYTECTISADSLTVKCPIDTPSINGKFRYKRFQLQELIDDASMKVAVKNKAAPIVYKIYNIIDVKLRTAGKLEISNMDFCNPKVIYAYDNGFTPYILDTSVFIHGYEKWCVNSGTGTFSKEFLYTGPGEEWVVKLNPVGGISGCSFDFSFDEYNTEEFFGEIFVESKGHFRFFWKLLTSAGVTYLAYDTRNWNEKKITTYTGGKDVRFGIGGTTLSDVWQSCIFPLQDDLDSVCSKVAVPKEKIFAVLGVTVRADSTLYLSGLYLVKDKEHFGGNKWNDYALNFAENIREEWSISSGSVTGTEIARESYSGMWGTRLRASALMTTCFKLPLQRPNEKQFFSKFTFKTGSDFKIYYEIETDRGLPRYLSYDTRAEKVNERWITVSSGNANYGIGRNEIDNLSHTRIFNLQADLDEICDKTRVPREKILTVRNILLRTNGTITVFELTLSDQASN